jgi:hypothetical protein
MLKSSQTNPPKTLTLLITANIVLDITAIAIWAALPANTWNGMYRLDSLVAISEASLAAMFFAVTLFGLKKRRNWAPFLAITITITQRVFAVYVFFPSIAIPIPLIWSLIVIYFSFKTIKHQKFLNLHTTSPLKKHTR